RARQPEEETAAAADPEGSVPVARRAPDPLGAEDDWAAGFGNRRMGRRPALLEGRDRAAAAEPAPAAPRRLPPGEPALAGRVEQPPVEREVADAEPVEERLRARLPLAAGERLEPERKRRRILRRDGRVAARPLPLRLHVVVEVEAAVVDARVENRKLEQPAWRLRPERRVRRVVLVCPHRAIRRDPEPQVGEDRHNRDQVTQCY